MIKEKEKMVPAGWPVIALAVLLLAGGCGLKEKLFPSGKSSGGSAGGSADESTDQAAARLAEALAKARGIDEARPVVREVLARSGMTVITGSGKISMKAVAPEVKLRVLEFQADNLALDALDRSGFSLAELSEAMAGLPGADAFSDPEVLPDIVAAWVESGRLNRKAPESFAALFVDAFHKGLKPPVDLASSTLDPGAVDLTTLDMLLLATSPFRGGGKAGKEVKDKSACFLSFDPIESTAHAGGGGPCSWIQDTFGDDLGELIDQGAQAGAGYPAGKGWDSVTDLLDNKGKAAASAAAAAAGAAFSYVTALVSLIMSYGAYSITVTSDTPMAHYKHPTQRFSGYDFEGVAQEVVFTATVTSRPSMDPELQKCLSYVGIDLADEDSAKNAIVRWVDGHGVGKHAVKSGKGFDSKSASHGRMENKVDKNGKTSISLFIQIEDYDKEPWKSGELEKDYLEMKAEVFTENPSGGKIAGMVATQNIPDALKAWLDKWFPKKGKGRMDIEYHELVNYGFTQTHNAQGVKITIEGHSTKGLYSPWVVTLSGGGKVSGVSFDYSGGLNFTAVEGQKAPTAGTVKMDMKYGKIDLTGGFNADMSGGTARIEGSDGSLSRASNAF